MNVQVRLNENLFHWVISLYLNLILLEVLILSYQTAWDHVYNDIRFADVNKHVIFKFDWLFLAHKYSITNAEVFNWVLILSNIIHYLKVSTPMLFWSTRVFVRNNEIVDNSFLQIKYKVIRDMLEIFEQKWSVIRKVMSARLLEIIAKLAILNFIMKEI